MDTYTPLFSRLVDSSIWCEPDHVVKVFITMLAKKDPDHIVRGNAFNIGQWAHKTEGEVLEALKILSSPDKRRLEPQPHDGRRIEKVEEGWLMLNGAKYAEEVKKLHQRARNARAQAAFRERQKGKLPKQAPTAEERRQIKEYEQGTRTAGELGA